MPQILLILKNMELHSYSLYWNSHSFTVKAALLSVDGSNKKLKQAGAELFKKKTAANLGHGLSSQSFQKPIDVLLAILFWRTDRDGME